MPSLGPLDGLSFESGTSKLSETPSPARAGSPPSSRQLSLDPGHTSQPIGSAIVAALRLIDLFAGCGGMTRGFWDTGAYRPVFAVEFDEDAAATYRVNFGDHVVAAPIETVAEFPAADVVIG